MAEAALLVHRLVEQGADTLRDAAQLLAQNADKGYPAARQYRLLRAAAGDPMPTLTAEEAAAERRQRQLWEEPFDVSFRQLAEQVPALEDLEQRARSDPDSFLRELSFREAGMIGRTSPRNPRDRQIRIVWGMDKAVKRLLGPRSGLSDPVLASPSAERAAAFSLREAAGIDLRP